jgi:hypothetical protein
MAAVEEQGPVLACGWGWSADADRLAQHKSKGGMGFRDLHIFNKAMLGNQGWRLITRSDSLCARVLKGRYFHDGEFLSCTRKKHSSQTWRSILAGRDVLTRGLIKRIGNGRSTNIWNDPWIPMHFDARAITPHEGQEVINVSDLITKAGLWNEEVIKAIFLPIDANAILLIPLRPQEDDWWAWELEKHGDYMVRSAYRKRSFCESVWGGHGVY